MRIRPQPRIDEIEPYVGGASAVPGVAEAVKLSSNENPLGPGDAALAAYARAAHGLNRYPPTDHADLRQAIAEVHGLDAERIICGAGSDEVLDFLCRAYSGPDTEVIHTEHGFSMYRIYALAAGATPVSVPERERVVDVDAILAAVNHRTRLVFIANPGNPTGTMLGKRELARLAQGLPESVLLVIDAAYAEYAEGHDGGAHLVTPDGNVVMTRTFSKLYGLGGLRIGWGYGPADVIDILNRVRSPFNLSVSQLATAEAAVRDRAHVARCQAENARLRAWLTEALRGLGLEVDESHTNFVLARFETPELAEACDAWLRERGLIVRRVAGYGFPEGLRITIGDEPACRRVAHAIGQFLADRAEPQPDADTPEDRPEGAGRAAQ